MVKKILGIGTLAFFLFAFVAPAEVYAQTKKQKEDIEKAIKAASEKNPKEARESIEVIEKVLAKIDDANAAKPKTTLGKLFPHIQSYREMMAAAEEYKNAKTDLARSNATAKGGIAMLNAINHIGDKKAGPIDAQVISGLTLMGTSLINAASLRMTQLAWTEAIGAVSAPANLTDSSKQKLGMHLYKSNISLQDISDVFRAIDKLNAIN